MGSAVTSLSARRAWIEIVVSLALDQYLKESLSARRAWIEMQKRHPLTEPINQSLSARRAWIEIVNFYLYSSAGVGRSPQGERG